MISAIILLTKSKTPILFQALISTGDHMKLHVVIEKDEAGYYVAEVPALPGCLSQGKTYEEAIANIKEAIEGWLEVMESKKSIDPSQLIEIAI
jgi:predicted RNase H-like HicB family nuclease